MVSVSLCMIVKNEEENIDRCLESVKDVVDEIVIVDTGSTDKTKDVVKKYTDKIFDFAWIDDFAAARNYSFSKATKEYILWLDADDILKKEDVERFVVLKDSMENIKDQIDFVTFIYDYAFDAEGKPTLVFRRERLVKREKRYPWIGFIHEYIAATGTGLDADVHVTHTKVHGNGERNIRIYQKKMEEHVEFSSRDQYYYGKELYYHTEYQQSIEVLKKYLTMDGWIEDRLDAMHTMCDCYTELKDYKMARKMIYKAFEEAAPRAEGLYRLGKTYQEEKKPELAIAWYELIFHLKRPDTKGFTFEECRTWRPHLDLCVCYYMIGDLKASREHNELAAQYVPNHPSVKKNKDYFNSIK